ncbi:uncharacterized protein LOC142588835 [Dermacentor variabilis]|uniref:uncharacterized protein LOC142588835 n=1 Tax=Dermacentor variabilis TaxID=34621 RepID=UPI003F5C16BB
MPRSGFESFPKQSSFMSQQVPGLDKRRRPSSKRFISASCNHGGGINDVRGVAVGGVYCERPGGEGGSKAPIIAVVVILLLLGAILIYFVTSSGKESDNVTSEGEVTSGGGDGGGGFSGDSSGDTNYLPGPPKTTQPPPTTKGPEKHIKLTCTLGRSGVLETQLPPDKMCDYIFYMHIYYDVREKKLTSLYGPIVPRNLEKVASSYNTTTLGLSMALSLMPAFPPGDKDAIKNSMTSQFQIGYKHFGALDVDIRDYPAAKAGGLQYLKFMVHICM